MGKRTLTRRAYGTSRTKRWVDFQELQERVTFEQVWERLTCCRAWRAGDEPRGQCPLPARRREKQSFSINVSTQGFTALPARSGATFSTLRRPCEHGRAPSGPWLRDQFLSSPETPKPVQADAPDQVRVHTPRRPMALMPPASESRGHRRAEIARG
jgi:hypothetical protein